MNRYRVQERGREDEQGKGDSIKMPRDFLDCLEPKTEREVETMQQKPQIKACQPCMNLLEVSNFF